MGKDIVIVIITTMIRVVAEVGTMVLAEQEQIARPALVAAEGSVAVEETVVVEENNHIVRQINILIVQTTPY